MEKIGNQNTWSYFDEKTIPRSASNRAIRSGSGHRVRDYLELAKKIAELQFLNPDHVLLFRGQSKDYRTSKNSSMLKASIFRREEKELPTQKTLEKRFEILRLAENELVKTYSCLKQKDTTQVLKRLKRYRIIRWAILQHYQICETPLIDVSRSLRIAASFASNKNETGEAFVFAFAVPNLSGAVTASSEAGLQIIRLSGICPPHALRPHIQEGYVLGEYPEISDICQNHNYNYYEMDFGRRLVAKFRFDPNSFWEVEDFRWIKDASLYPAEDRDPFLQITNEITKTLNKKTG